MSVLCHVTSALYQPLPTVHHLPTVYQLVVSHVDIPHLGFVMAVSDCQQLSEHILHGCALFTRHTL